MKYAANTALLLMLATDSLGAVVMLLPGSTTTINRASFTLRHEQDPAYLACCVRVDTLITYTGVPCPWPGWSAHVTQYREEP